MSQAATINRGSDSATGSVIIKFLGRLGHEYRKPKALPRVSPAGKQAGVIEKYNRLMTGPGADEAVYFADAAHPEYQIRPAFGWVRAGSRSAVPTTAGRGRVNIHGAINLETYDTPFIEPTTVDGTRPRPRVVQQSRSKALRGHRNGYACAGRWAVHHHA